MDRTGFFPAAFKVTQGWLGLIFRKPATRTFGSGRTKLLSQVVTRDSKSMDEVSEWLVRETIITNFTGMLVDHPPRKNFPENMSAADELRLGFYPTVARYVGESILEVSKGIIGVGDFKVGLTRVRLLEDEGKQVRELTINKNGHYEVRIHRRDGSGLTVESYVPTRGGNPLTEIPFELINSEGSVTPTPSLIQQIVDLNLQHYRLEGSLASAIHLTSAPISIITGFEPETVTDENGVEVPKVYDFPVAPGAVWLFGAPKDANAKEGVKVDWHTHDPKGQELLTNKLRDIKDSMSAIGHSILAPEKPAPEAAETQLIRRAAENAMLAAFTQKVGMALESGWKKWATWADPASPVLAYQLNLDFVPQSLPDSTATFLSSLVDKGQLTLGTLHKALHEGELLPRDFDPEEEQRALESQQSDLPPVD